MKMHISIMVVLFSVATCWAERPSGPEGEGEPGRPGSRFNIGLSAFVKQSPYDDRDYRLIAFPFVSYFGKRLQVAGPRIAYRLVIDRPVTLSGVLNYRFDGFDTDESDRLDGMHSRQDTLTAGLVAGVERFRPYEARLAVETDVLGEHDGQRASVGVSRTVRIGKTIWTPGIEVAWESSSWADHYYGVRVSEATALRPAYEPGDTWEQSLQLGVRRMLTEKSALLGAIQWTWLDDAVSDSPIVVRDHVGAAFMAVSYSL